MQQSTDRDDIQLAEHEQLGCVIGTDGTPIYFAVDRNITDHEMSLEAFKVKHGRQATETELTLLGMIGRNHG